MLVLWAALLAVATPSTLSVRGAIDEALAHSPEVRLGEAAAARAEGERRGASALFPSDMTLGARYATAQPAGDPEHALDLSLSQELELAGQHGLRAGAAAADGRAAQERLVFMRQSLAARVWSAFGQAWQAAAQTQLAGELDQSNRALAQAAERRVAAGDLSALAANVVRIEAARSEARLARAQANERRARAELARLLGRTAAVTDRLEDPVGQVQDAADEQQWIAKALSARRDLQALRDSLEARRQRAGLARRSWVPNPTVQLGLTRERTAFGPGDFSGDASGTLSAQKTDTFLSLGVSVPLPSPARRGGQVQAANAEVEEAEAQLAQAEQAIAAEVRSALAQREEAARSLDVLSRIAQAATDNVELSRRGFEAGELDLATFLAARSSAFESQGELIDARAGVLAAQAALVAAAGEAP